MRAGARVCAQGAPTTVHTRGDAVSGVSGFAFQGTNAHVILRTVAAAPCQLEPTGEECRCEHAICFSRYPHPELKAWPSCA